MNADSGARPAGSRYRSIYRPGLFDGQLIVVTGAGSGIGRCTAHELAQLGATIAMIGRKRDKLEAVQAEIAANGGRASLYTCDIRDEAAVDQAFKAIVADHGRLDALVNNAGGQYSAPLEALSLKGWDSVVRNNLHGGFLCMQAALRLHMRDHGGAIVNMVADMWNGMPGMAHSGAARAGMLNLTETAASEWGQYGIRVNAVAPGWIGSSGFDTYDDETKAMIRTLPPKVPLQRFGTESEIAAAIVFLLSEGAAFITGTCIRIDGGVPNAKHNWPLQPMTHPSPACQAFDGFHLASRPRVLDGL
ncbi:MAG: SDR family oxidoreductase [Burkholderiaceae bacterium]